MERNCPQGLLVHCSLYHGCLCSSLTQYCANFYFFLNGVPISHLDTETWENRVRIEKYQTYPLELFMAIYFQSFLDKIFTLLNISEAKVYF